MKSMMRKAIIAGNWKMNTNLIEATTLVQKLNDIVNRNNKILIIVAPPFVHLQSISKIINGSNFKLAAQNMFWEEKGAFTGEISPLMLKEYNCEYVIIGHSERRQILLETDEMINKKLCACFKYNLIPILCVGETLQERKEDKTWKVIYQQLEKDLENIGIDKISDLIIAYEPIWAIGTGIAAKAEDAVSVNEKIREYLEKKYNKDIARGIRILYGGSVSSKNIEEFVINETIDGALVGGASLKFEEFSAIIEITNKIKGE